MDNKHSSDKFVGIFLLTVLSFIFIYKYEYIALVVWPAVVSQFPVLWKKDIEPSPNGYKQINKTSVVTYVVSFVISVLMLFLVVLYRDNFNSSLIIVAILASLAHEAIMLTILIPFVYDHRTDKKTISWGLYGLLALIFRSLSAMWLSESPIEGVFVCIIFPLIIIGSIIRYKIFLKSVKGERL